MMLIISKKIKESEIKVKPLLLKEKNNFCEQICSKQIRVKPMALLFYAIGRKIKKDDVNQ